MKTSKISVIIPVYNGEKTLRQCLTSVLDQSFNNYEVIVVDNNSSDNTSSIIKEFSEKDSRFKYAFENFRSRGAARNRGIIESKYDIIAMTDSDCIVPLNWLEELTKPIREGKEEICVGNEKDVNSQIEINNQEFRDIKIVGEYINFFDTKNCAFRRDLVDQIGFFDKNLNNSEDSDFGIRLLSHGKRIFYLKNLIVNHNHYITLYSWFKIQIDRSYWLNRSFRRNEDVLNRIPKNSYNSMSVNEFFYFFISAPMSLLLNKNKKKVFFNILTGLGFRIGIVKERLL